MSTTSSTAVDVADVECSFTVYVTMPPLDGSDALLAVPDSVIVFDAVWIAGIDAMELVLVCLTCVPEEIYWIGYGVVAEAVVPVIWKVYCAM